MVATAVGLLLMAGAMSIFLSNKRTYEVTDDLSRLQENARYALDAILRDLRMAGHVGCANSLETLANVAFDAGTQTRGGVTDFGTPTGSAEVGPGVEGIDELTDQITPPAGWTLARGSDGVTARYVSGPGAPLASDSETSAVTATGAVGIAAGELAAVVDCTSGVVFAVSRADTSGGETRLTAGRGLPRPYEGTPAGQRFPRVAPVRAARYYVALDGAGRPALRRQTAAADEPIVDGIEHLEVLYGVDENGNGRPDRYLRAGPRSPENADEVNSVEEWRGVVTVRLGLLARTVDEYGAQADTRAYDLFTGQAFDTPSECTGAGCVDPADLRVRRRVFTTTAFVRNRS
jgi:type IV pilus assembly protein PilW